MQINFYQDKLYQFWRNIDKKILISFILLFLLGLFFSFSSTSSLAGERLNKDYYHFFLKHLIFVFISLSMLIVISFIELNLLKKSIIPIFLFLVLVLILVPLFGIEVKGSKRWLSLYFFRFQPIEFIKPFLMLMTAKILTHNEDRTSNISFFLSFIVLTIIVILLVNQPDLGQSILLIGVWISVVFVSGISLIYIISFFGFSLLSIVSLVLIFPEKFGYITKRVTSFLDPSKGDSFQSQKALEAIKQGGIKGQGMGEGILKDNVPEAHTDYIIAVIAEEFGSIISIMIVMIFLYISFRVIKITISEKDKFIKISLCGLISLLVFQTFIHIGVNTSILPTTGMTLPFLSYGGSSLFGSSILAGLILNFTKKRFDYET